MWRAAPRDSFQAAALSQYVAEVEARLAPELWQLLQTFCARYQVES